MPVVVACPTCGNGIRCPDSVLGKTISCPSCRARLVPTVPAIEPPSAAREPAPVVLLPDEPPRLHQPRGRAERNEEADDFDFRDADEERTARRTGFRCPYCGSRALPTTKKKVSSAGWAFFWILLLFLCFPLCWIGLFMKDEFRVCGDCGMKLG